MVKQARKQGAKTFIHYSFPRHMSNKILSRRRDFIREACMGEGIEFVDLTAPDPTDSTGIEGAKQFLLDDVPRMVAKYGKDTAFFHTNCHIQATLIKAVLDNHAIFPQPCCPSPFHGFPEALGIDNPNFDLHHIIDEASRIVKEKNMSDRFSTWPVSAIMACANAGVEYAIKWLDGKVPKTRIDNEVLLECIEDYIREVLGEDGYVVMTSYEMDGATYDNVKWILMSYLDF